MTDKSNSVLKSNDASLGLVVKGKCNVQSFQNITLLQDVEWMLNDVCSISSSTSKQVAPGNMFISRSTHAQKGIKSSSLLYKPWDCSYFLYGHWDFGILQHGSWDWSSFLHQHRYCREFDHSPKRIKTQTIFSKSRVAKLVMVDGKGFKGKRIRL